MTWEQWSAMSPCERDAARDNSGLCPQLVGLEGRRVRVTPKRPYGPNTFIVGRTTGWRPCHLAIRARNAHGSSDTLGPKDIFQTVKVL